MSELKHRMLAAAFSILAIMTAASSSAATIDTFSFTQSYQYAFLNGVQPGHTDTLIGSFTGYENSAGYITRDSLTAFSAHLDHDGATLATVDLSWFHSQSTFFSFYAAGSPLDNSSLDIFGDAGLGGFFCVGQLAAFGACGSHKDPLKGVFFANLSYVFATDLAPVAFLESRVVTGVPEPSTWVMMILGFAGLGLWAPVNRRRFGLSTAKGLD